MIHESKLLVVIDIKKIVIGTKKDESKSVLAALMQRCPVVGVVDI